MEIKNIKIGDSVNVLVGESIYSGEVLSLKITPTAIDYEIKINRLGEINYYNACFVFTDLKDAVNEIERRWGKIKE